MTKYKLNGIKLIGIIPDSAQAMANFASASKVKFPLFIPEALKKFRKALRMRFNMPQTLLLKNGKVAYLKVGDLSGVDFEQLVQKLRILQESSS